MRLTYGVGFVLPLLILAAITMPHNAGAQQVPAPPAQPKAVPSIELTYAYTHTNGPPGSCGCINLNGGGAAFLYPLHTTPFSLEGQFSAADGNRAGYDLRLFTYTAGARYSPKLKRATLEPYAEVLAGIVHAGGNYASATGLGSAFAGTVGGGLNLHLHHHLGLKLFQADYVANNFSNGSTDHQNNFRLSAGMVLHLQR